MLLFLFSFSFLLLLTFCQESIIQIDESQKDLDQLDLTPESIWEISVDESDKYNSWSTAGVFATHVSNVASNFQMVYHSSVCYLDADYLEVSIRMTKCNCFSVCNWVFGIFDGRCIMENTEHSAITGGMINEAEVGADGSSISNNLDNSDNSNKKSLDSGEDIYCGSIKFCEGKSYSIGYASSTGRILSSETASSGAYGEVWTGVDIVIKLYADIQNNRLGFFHDGLLQGWIDQEFTKEKYPYGIRVGMAMNHRDAGIVELLHYDCHTPTNSPTRSPTRNPTKRPTSGVPTQDPIPKWTDPCTFSFKVTVHTFRTQKEIENKYRNDIVHSFVTAFEDKSTYNNRYHFTVTFYTDATQPQGQGQGEPDPDCFEDCGQDVYFNILITGNLQLVCDNLYLLVYQEVEFKEFIQNEFEIVLNDKGSVVLDFALEN